MNETVLERKSNLRKQLRAEASRHGLAERREASARICERLRMQDRWNRARSVLLFAPMTDEPDIWPLVGEALSVGRSVALPRYCRPSDEYEACEVADPGRQIRLGHCGIREPDETGKIIPWNKLDFVLIPGIGFGVDGMRLGRGKGYYDRLLGRTDGFKCGVAFDWQVMDGIPSEAHDIRLDCILTPTRWHQVV